MTCRFTLTQRVFPQGGNFPYGRALSRLSLGSARLGLVLGIGLCFGPRVGL